MQFVGLRIFLKKDEIIFSFVMIRNEMVDLEDLGFIEKIYLFLGWILLEKGYRYYVDYLLLFVKLIKIDLDLIYLIFKEKIFEFEKIV